MVENVVTKPLGVVLIVVAHMVFNVLGQAEVIGILGTDVILQFTFNVSFTEKSHFGGYRAKGFTDQKKIAEYKLPDKKTGIFDIYPHNNSVVWQITNLKLNDSANYWATLFDQSPALKSNEVQLIVREENRSTTVPPMQSTTPVTEDRESSSYIIAVLVVSPVVLLAAVLPCLIWCLLRPKDKQQRQQPPPQQSSSPTVQETVETSKNVPASSLVYSVLDFPKRPPAAVELNPSDTEYAAVSQKRTV